MRWKSFFIWILIGWYLVLILGHYFNRRPLWNDELCVLNSIIQLKPPSLFFQPLLSDQSFPRVYLWVIQQFSRPFNFNPLALRFFPLLAMMSAFFIWLAIARRFLNNAGDLVFFVGAWGASIPLVYYAAELKPYSMDVLGAGLIVLFLTEQKLVRQNSRAYKIVLLFLPVLGLFSYPVLFLLLLPLYNLIRDCFEKSRWLPELSFFLVGYCLVLVFVYLFDFRVSVPHLLEVFWHDYFISLHSFKDFLNTFGKGINNLIARRFAESPRWVKGPSRFFVGLGVGYMLMAWVTVFKKDRFALRSIVPIAFMVFLMQLVLSILRVFPFAVPRLSLFYSPLLILMVITVMRVVCRYQRALGMFCRIVFAGYLIFISTGIAWDIFIKRDLGAESTLFSSK